MTPPRPRSIIAGRKARVRTTTASQLTRTISAWRSRSRSAKSAAQAEAGVVDEEVDVDAELLDLARAASAASVAEVAGDHLGVVGKAAGELRRAGPCGGRRGSARAALGELPRELLADSRRGAGDQCRLCHARSLSRPHAARGENIGRVTEATIQFADRVRAWEAEYLWERATPLVSGAARAARGRQPGADAVPARPRPDRALEGVPAAQAQDAGVRRAGGRPLPDAAHPHARGLLHLANGRAGAGAERGPDRGDRARARPRPSALRPHRRGGARRGDRGARDGASSTTSTRCGWSRCSRGARRAWGST